MAILVLYSTTDGHTKTITDEICKTLHEINASADIEQMDLQNFLQSGADLERFERIILGASIRYGRHQKAVTTFIEKYHDALASKVFAFFSVNLTARKPEKNAPQNNPYMLKFYQQLPVKPDIDAVFAGRLAYPEYKWYDKLMIQLIMKITKGPTDPSTVVVFTDWSAVRRFAQKIIEYPI